MPLSTFPAASFFGVIIIIVAAFELIRRSIKDFKAGKT